MKKRADIKRTVILLAHGSPKNHAKNVLLKIKNKISKYFAKSCILKYAFIQFDEPSLLQCLNRISSKVRHIVILPVFISHGKHTLNDIPMIVKSFKKNRKKGAFHSVNVVIAEPLEAHDMVVKALYSRYMTAIGKD
ncbi:MAG: hypothetical protein HYR97_00295 [Candidatus Melainabacteria bacterium]|nr:hypothetical protein [Candidatus Melainabacteria bacterium]